MLSSGSEHFTSGLTGSLLRYNLYIFKTNAGSTCILNLWHSKLVFIKRFLWGIQSYNSQNEEMYVCDVMIDERYGIFN